MTQRGGTAAAAEEGEEGGGGGPSYLCASPVSRDRLLRKGKGNKG